MTYSEWKEKRKREKELLNSTSSREIPVMEDLPKASSSNSNNGIPMSHGVSMAEVLPSAGDENSMSIEASEAFADSEGIQITREITSEQEVPSFHRYTQTAYYSRCPRQDYVTFELTYKILLNRGTNGKQERLEKGVYDPANIQVSSDTMVKSVPGQHYIPITTMSSDFSELILHENKEMFEKWNKLRKSKNANPGAIYSLGLPAVCVNAKYKLCRPGHLEFPPLVPHACFTLCARQLVGQKAFVSHQLQDHTRRSCPICFQEISDFLGHIKTQHSIDLITEGTIYSPQDELNMSGYGTPLKFSCSFIETFAVIKSYPTELFLLKLPPVAHQLTIEEFRKIVNLFRECIDENSIWTLPHLSFDTDLDRSKALVAFCDWVNSLNKNKMIRPQKFLTGCFQILKGRIIPRYSWTPSSLDKQVIQGFVPASQYMLAKFLRDNSGILKIWKGSVHTSEECKFKHKQPEFKGGIVIATLTENSSDFVRLAQSYSHELKIFYLGSWARQNMFDDIHHWLEIGSPLVYENIYKNAFDHNQLITAHIGPFLKLIDHMLFSMDKTSHNVFYQNTFDRLEVTSVKYTIFTEPVVFSMVRDMLVLLETRDENKTLPLSIDFTRLMDSIRLNRQTYLKFIPTICLIMGQFETRTTANDGKIRNGKLIPLLERYKIQPLLWQFFSILSSY